MFPEKSTSVPCMTEKGTLKTSKRLITIMREKKVCRPWCPSSVLCYAKVDWSLPSQSVPAGFEALAHGDLVDKHSYTGTKLSCMAPNSIWVYTTKHTLIYICTLTWRNLYIWYCVCMRYMVYIGYMCSYTCAYMILIYHTCVCMFMVYMWYKCIQGLKCITVTDKKPFLPVFPPLSLPSFWKSGLEF